MKELKIARVAAQSSAERKKERNERIRQKLNEHVEVQVIPAKSELETEKRKTRVAAYCRVSTDMDTQAMSYELQVQNYTEYIQSHEEWELVGIYADQGISGTSMRRRDEFNRMIADCEEGKIDLIITKAVTRFARNVVDTITTVRKLKHLDPPVGVFFETERINTLDTTSETYLGLISLFAQGESESKSESLKWSYIRRWRRGAGIYPIWSLIGYITDENGEWEIVESEAELVRIIYEMYQNGYSSPQIADILNKSGVPSPMELKGVEREGKERILWSSGAVLSILRNEKYCGDALCQKTMSLDIFTHKSIKNKGQKPQYFIENHHEAIVEKDDWLTVQQLIRERHYVHIRKRRTKPKPVMHGCLKGFMPVNLEWKPEDIDALFGNRIAETQEKVLPPLADHVQIINIKGD